MDILIALLIGLTAQVATSQPASLPATQSALRPTSQPAYLIYNGKPRSEQWAKQVYRQQADILAFKDGKCEYISAAEYGRMCGQKATQTQPAAKLLTFDEFVLAVRCGLALKIYYLFPISPERAKIMEASDPDHLVVKIEQGEAKVSTKEPRLIPEGKFWGRSQTNSPSIVYHNPRRTVGGENRGNWIAQYRLAPGEVPKGSVIHAEHKRYYQIRERPVN